MAAFSTEHPWVVRGLALLGILASLATIWVVFTRDTVPEFLAKRGVTQVDTYHLVVVLLLLSGLLLAMIVVQAVRVQPLGVANPTLSRKLVIQAAKYGIENQYKDVKTLLEGHVHNDQVDIPVVELAVPVDPFPDQRKHVKVVYVVGDGQPQRIVRHDGHQLIIPEREDSPLAQRNLSPNTAASIDESSVDQDSLQRELGQVKKERDEARETLVAKTRAFAHERLRIYSSMAWGDDRSIKPTVTIRFVKYGKDHALAKQIQQIFGEFTNWETKLDWANDPVLPEAEQCKVVFESGWAGAFRPVANAFLDGDLLGVPVCWNDGDRSDQHHLVIKVLPSADAV